MEKRIKIFDLEDMADLEHAVNNFLSSTPGKLQDIKYQCFESNFDVKYFTALIIYIPHGRNDEEKNKNAEKNEKGNGRISNRITPLWEQVGAACKV